MRLAYNCEDVLSLKLSRRLITMVKVRDAAPGEGATCAITEAEGVEPAHATFPQKYFEVTADASSCFSPPFALALVAMAVRWC